MTPYHKGPFASLNAFHLVRLGPACYLTDNAQVQASSLLSMQGLEKGSGFRAHQVSLMT